MTIPENIMTIKLNINVISDVFKDKNWIIFSNKNENSDITISLFEVISSSDNFSHSIESLDDNCAKITSKYVFNKLSLSSYTVFLFISHSAWIKESRISNYKKLWKSLPDNWNIKSLSLGNEYLFRSDKRIKYAGIVKVNKQTYRNALNLLRLSQSNLMVLTHYNNYDSEEKVSKIFNLAFHDKKSIRLIFLIR